MNKSAKIIVMVLGIFLLPSLLSAAPKEKKKNGIEAGLRIGPVFASHWSVEDSIEGFTIAAEPQPGLEVGVTLAVPIISHLYLQGELLLVDKGAKYSVTGETVPYDDLTLSFSTLYYEIPVTLRFSQPLFRFLTLSVQGGGFLAFMGNSRADIQATDLPNLREDLEDVKSFDYGLLGSAALSVHTGVFVLSLEYRYTLGFNDIVLSTDPELPVIELRNRCSAVLLGIGFRM